METVWKEEIIPVGDAQLKARVRRGGVPSAPMVLHLHGGAFQGSLESGRTVAELLAESGADVVSADYPVGQANPFPCALEAAYEALLWTHRADRSGKNRRLFVAGEDAGGNLAAGLTLVARDRHAPPLAGQILLSPMLDPCLATGSIRRADAGPAGCKWAEGWRDYLGSADKASHPYAAPLGSSRLTGLPSALVLTAEDDPMRDEAVSYAKRLLESGVPVEQHILPAPTGWPDAFRESVGTKPAWAATILSFLVSFFARTCPHPTGLRPIRT